MNLQQKLSSNISELNYATKHTLSCILVPGNWGPWGAWADCNCTTMSETRIRYCDKPAPVNGGDECQGDQEQAQDCTENICPSKSQYHHVV